ncbi:hypothetical protein CEXT_357671, partial [Caerostris extrusa]
MRSACSRRPVALKVWRGITES